MKRILLPMHVALVSAALVGGPVACGSDGGSSPASGGGGHAGTAGNVAGGGETSAGGAISMGGMGASGTAAGVSGKGAGGSASDEPTGAVANCTGDGCPYGRCNNSAALTCDSVYPGPLGAGAEVCKSDGEYCLVTGSAFNFQSWAVRCKAGVARSEKCSNSCGFNLINHTSKCS